ncbi:Rho GTPase-activating protein [Elasticomyces elasticus]|nr:Rho GTPase-activating protein [Elasticomyces elasticus]
MAATRASNQLNGDTSDNVVDMSSAAASATPSGGASKAVDEILFSDASTRSMDFADFLKKRASLEETHAKGLKRICKDTHDTIRRLEGRQGSYAQALEGVLRVHERMADNGMQFALSLGQMHDDLNELSSSMERGRKQWKHDGMSAEKHASDAQSSMEKAKSKYDSLAEDYDRARTGDRTGSRRIGLKGPKSAEQHEQDLLRKVQAADTDYASKVQVAQAQRRDLWDTSRPQAISALRELIEECDSALTLQLQKFATFNEKLLLGNGLAVSPLKPDDSNAAPQRSLRDIVYQINNHQDLEGFVTSLQVPQKPSEIRYEKHPANHPQPSHQQPGYYQSAPPPQQAYGQAPQYQAPPTQYEEPPYPTGSTTSRTAFPQQPSSSVTHTNSMIPHYGAPTHLANDLPVGPPIKPVFGVSLDELFQRDGSAVPLVVYQCTQAVDLFGLDVEGIYRLSGNANHVAKLRAMFDHDSAKVDFRNPENFFHDVNSVAGLLKQFFRDLPDPLLTRAHYGEFIEAARIDDEIVRRDSLHAVINALPDPNYATLRALVLHLNHVQAHYPSNRMSTSNIAICFAPTLMGSHTGPQIADAGLQARVLDTILMNTYQIFDEEEQFT